ncbi:MAG: hypothetical protein R3C68_13885 [Myxococcota bacterium]
MPERLQAFISYQKNLIRVVENIQSNLHTPLPHTYVDLGKSIFGGMATFLKGRAEVKPLTTRLPEALRQSNQGAIAALQRLTQWFGRQAATANDDFALGAEKFAAMLRRVEAVDT